MTVPGLVWIGIAVVALVFLDLLYVKVRSIFYYGGRIVSRLQGYAELPIWSRLAAGATDIERIAQASEDIPALIGRGQRAIATLRSYLPKGMSPG